MPHTHSHSHTGTPQNFKYRILVSFFFSSAAPTLCRSVAFWEFIEKPQWILKKSIGFRTEQRDTQSGKKKLKICHQPEAWSVFTLCAFSFYFSIPLLEGWFRLDQKEGECVSLYIAAPHIVPPPTVLLSFCLSFCFACNSRQWRHTHRKGGFFSLKFWNTNKTTAAQRSEVRRRKLFSRWDLRRPKVEPTKNRRLVTQQIVSPLNKKNIYQRKSVFAQTSKKKKLESFQKIFRPSGAYLCSSFRETHVSRRFQYILPVICLFFHLSFSRIKKWSPAFGAKVPVERIDTHLPLCNANINEN